MLGANTDLTIANGFPGATALLFFGVVQTSVPFDGGTLLVTPLVTLSLPLNGSGGLSLPISVPADASLCAFPAHFQVMVFGDPGAAGYYQTSQTKGLTWTLRS